MSSSLTDQELTYTLCMLLSLTTASCVSGLQHLDIRFMTKGDSKAKLMLSSIRVGVKANHPHYLQSLVFLKIPNYA